MKLKNIFNKMGKKEDKNQVSQEEIDVKDQNEIHIEENSENTENEEIKNNNSSSEEDELAKVKIELAEAKDKYLRLFAEFDNFRKRTNKEKLEMRKVAAKDTLSAIIPVLDDFDRAKKNHDDESSEEEFSEGVMFVYEKILSFTKSQGLEPMESTGQKFDPDFHEAITEIAVQDEEMKGKVVDTVERGYKLNDVIIRYAKVVVGK